MPGFIGPLKLEDLGDGRRWRTLEEVCYEVGAPGSGWAITVPAGFVTDLASSPWWTWWFMPPSGRYNRAAVVHDWLCEQTNISRPVADAIWIEMLVALDCELWRVVLAGTGVFLYGLTVQVGRRWRRRQGAV